jgi:hypothetical protein
MASGARESLALLVTHPWTSVSLAPIQAYRDALYSGSTASAAGFGYEDWHWNVEQLALGRSHVITPRTALLYRKRGNSLLARQNADRRILAPSRFFSPEVFLPIAGSVNSRLEVPNGTKTGFLARVSSRVRRYSQKIVATNTAPRAATGVPSWLMKDLKSLAALEPALDATNSGLANLIFWEPNLRLGPGIEYAQALYATRRLLASDRLTLCCSDAAAAAAVRARRGAVLQWRAVTALAQGDPSPSRDVVVLRDHAEPPSSDDSDKVLTRLLVQIRPRMVEYENCPRLRNYFQLYSRGLLSAGVTPRRLAGLAASDGSSESLDEVNGAESDHGTT